MQMPSVSIIVPMYNVEKYVSQCIDSLLSQSLHDIEIILVDDGSPDCCGEIAESYKAIDERVKVIHQENMGLGPARNSGIKQALGEYIGFVDGDDWACPDMFLHLYEAVLASKADIICGGFCIYTDGVMKEKLRHPLAGLLVSDHDQIMQIRKNLYGHKLGDRDTKSFPVTVCSNLYRRAFIEKNHLSFREIMSEDTIFNLPAFSRASSIFFSDCTSYCYRKEGQASITRSLSPRTLNRYEQFIEALYLSAEGEAERDRPDCISRAFYAAEEYARLYAGVVAQSACSRTEKISEMKRLAQSRLFSKYASQYPANKLQPYQRLFHQAMLSSHYKFALWLVGLRQAIGRVR